MDSLRESDAAGSNLGSHPRQGGPVRQARGRHTVLPSCFRPSPELRALAHGLAPMTIALLPSSDLACFVVESAKSFGADLTVGTRTTS